MTRPKVNHTRVIGLSNVERTKLARERQKLILDFVGDRCVNFKQINFFCIDCRKPGETWEARHVISTLLTLGKLHCEVRGVNGNGGGRQGWYQVKPFERESIKFEIIGGETPRELLQFMGFANSVDHGRIIRGSAGVKYDRDE